MKKTYLQALVGASSEAVGDARQAKTDLEGSFNRVAASEAKTEGLTELTLKETDSEKPFPLKMVVGEDQTGMPVLGSKSVAAKREEPVAEPIEHEIQFGDFDNCDPVIGAVLVSKSVAAEREELVVEPTEIEIQFGDFEPKIYKIDPVIDAPCYYRARNSIIDMLPHLPEEETKSECGAHSPREQPEKGLENSAMVRELGKLLEIAGITFVIEELKTKGENKHLNLSEFRRLFSKLKVIINEIDEEVKPEGENKHLNLSEFRRLVSKLKVIINEIDEEVKPEGENKHQNIFNIRQIYNKANVTDVINEIDEVVKRKLICLLEYGDVLLKYPCSRMIKNIYFLKWTKPQDTELENPRWRHDRGLPFFEIGSAEHVWMKENRDDKIADKRLAILLKAVFECGGHTGLMYFMMMRIVCQANKTAHPEIDVKK